MDKQKTFSDSVLEFNAWLANISLELFDNYTISNPFNGKNKDKIKEITKTFYKKYYNDNNKRYLILGSSPARKAQQQQVFHLKMRVIFIKKLVL